MSDSQTSIIIKAKDLASKVMNKLGRTIDGLKGKSMSLAKDGFGKILSAGKAMTTGLIGGLLGGLGVSALTAAGNFETMQTALNTAFQGNKEAAKAAFDQINDFTAKTPFQLEEVMTGFVKLKNMGLDPSQRALRSYGDTASSMGKGLNDMVEAVADAATGEFERLKEFGIRASQQGDKVTFTFKGVETTVAKNSKAIEDYLINLGETNFAGGMEAQSQTLMGKLSTLKDTFKLTIAAFANDTGLTDWAKKGIDSASQLLSGIKPLYDLIVKGDYTKGLNDAFGWAEDGEIVSKIFEIRDGIRDLTDRIIQFVKNTGIIEFVQNFVQDGEKMKALLVGIGAAVLTPLIIGFGSLAVAVISATWPFVLLALAVGGLYYAYQTNLWGIKDIVDAVFGYIANEIWPMLQRAFDNFVNNVWPKFVEAWEGFVNNVWPIIQEALLSIWDNIINNLWPAIMGLWDVIQNQWLPALINLWNFISPVLIPILIFVASVIGVTLYVAIQILVTAITWLIQTWTWMYSTVAWVINGVIGFFQNLGSFWDYIKTLIALGIIWVVRKFFEFRNNINNVINTVKNYFQGLWDKANSVKNGVVNTFQGIGRGIVNGIKWGVNSAIDSLNGLITGANNIAGAVGGPQIPYIPKFAKGTPYVPRDMLAYIHEGEAIIPKKYNPAAGGNLGGGSSGGGGQTVTINIDAKGALLDDKTIADFARRTKKIFNQQGFATT